MPLNPTTRSQMPEAVAQKVESMELVNQAAFEDEFNKKRKSLGTSYFFWLFGFHYLYMGKFMTFIFFFITFGGLFIWWLFDVFRLPSIVRNHNKTVALSVLRDIQVLS